MSLHSQIYRLLLTQNSSVIFKKYSLLWHNQKIVHSLFSRRFPNVNVLFSGSLGVEADCVALLKIALPLFISLEVLHEN